MRTQRRTTFRAGLAVVTIGAVLGIAGLTANPAAAEKPDTFKITLCHRTNAPSNPYRVIEVSVDAGNGELVGPDHTGHPGPAFDFDADPQDADYPYTSPRNGDQWGDVIPPFSWDGGSYAGSDNWTEGGEEIWDAGCQGADEPADPECPEGQDWNDANDDGVLDEGECETPSVFECPEGTEGTDANDNGEVDEGECVAPSVFECPEGTEGADANDNGEVDEGECEAPEVPVVGQPEKPADVQGEVITAVQPATLPRTGSTTLPMAEVGFGLVLLGLGAMLAGKQDAATV